MKYTENELMQLAKSADYVDTYRFTGANHNVHTDNVEYIGNGMNNTTEIDCLPYDNEGEVDAYVEIMGRSEYNYTILANTCVEWRDMYEENDKVLVIILY